ncbi:MULTISPECIES: hypothetical protein [Streptomyces]|uniref:Uncharacterized protein n=1 Tax=Streptomyces glycanivorans TaxID=3033808 RepID=A0ABY9JKY4_9ACTN|nr:MULTISPECIES: hypothetical protein [unclassified Streptomyces]WSQ80124.1 hypothetical protein OG725_24835 [Streptomyces sp. NBC_01213]TXS07748.1 hypothetical protein EAO68_38735 [Streptomyces sp. wa22]WLQ66706.1 hypothetical protein P8A20_25420 [Streptomyces sp. Alt3]WSQ87455.1 hypothetical protein OG722_25270 [Streptomyces sp. NBC_01212]WSR06534.1 hypothetical protein OG265_11190 [Streptomyces sp. NBC_01208]
MDLDIEIGANLPLSMACSNVFPLCTRFASVLGAAHFFVSGVTANVLMGGAAGVMLFQRDLLSTGARDGVMLIGWSGPSGAR